MIAAVIGWLFLVVELLVAAPVWAVAHAYAQGEGFAPQQAQWGYGALIGTLMRPTALVFGFVFMFYIMNIAMWFASMALALYISTMLTSSTFGLGSFIGTMSVIMATAFMVVKYVVQMITHLPDNLPKWIGGNGTNTGDLNAAVGAQGDANRFSSTLGSSVQQGTQNAMYMAREGAMPGGGSGGSGNSPPPRPNNPQATNEKGFAAEMEKEIQDFESE